jgi:hypothetical protein
MKNKILILLPVVFAIEMGFSQTIIKNVSKVGTSAATFLEIPVGTAAIGMGDAFVSIANDATALYWNVAGIARMKKNEVFVVHNAWIAGTSFDFAAVVLKLSASGTLGLSITALSMDDMKVRTIEKPDGTGEYFGAGDIQVGLSYAMTLTDRFAFGFTSKYIQQKIWHMRANAIAFDFGTTFLTDLFGGMTIGASISNFGTSMKLSGRDTRRFYSVDDSKLGSNASIPHNIEMDSADLPLLFQIGVSTDAIKTENFRWTIAIDALHPSDDYESINIGTEFAFSDFIFLRGGYRSLFLDDLEGGLSIGLGLVIPKRISTSQINFDYAFRDMGRLKNIQLYSISINF